jgi:hypothetical protein
VESRDPVAPLLRAFEEALDAGDRAALTALFDPSMAPDRVARYAAELLMPGAIDTTLRERARSQLEGAPPGDGYTIIIEFFIETAGRARILTASMDMQRPPGGEPSTWRFVGAEGLTFVEGLYRLRLNTDRPLQARNFEVASEDFTLLLTSGTVFLVECDQGVTGLVLLGRGQMRFSPPDEAERGQLRIFGGDEALVTPFEQAFVRLSPLDYESRVSAAGLTPAPADGRLARRAGEVFAREAKQSFLVDLQDLTPHDWHLLPPAGDFLAEVRTGRFDTLTYSLASERAEDVGLFHRDSGRTISIYPSAAKLAARGRFYSDDAFREYDVIDYDIEAVIDPDRQVIQSRARMQIRVRTTSLAAVKLRLADSLRVTGVTSLEYGRLLHFRMRSEDLLLVNLPRVLLQDSDLTLVITYAGRVEPSDLSTDTVAVSPEPGAQGSFGARREPAFLLSNRSYWYPQNHVPDYATASMRIRVPDGYTCVASGHPEDPDDVVSLREIVSGERDDEAFLFRARQPLRYLALVIGRFSRREERRVTLGDTGGAGGIDAIELVVQAETTLGAQARSTANAAGEILHFYGSLLGDAPYTAMALALVESDLPGGHSPGYFALLNTPVSLTTVNWRDDPAAFRDFPEFFLAHELAHQWWGQAVGWKNYHEQWLSEGFAQYFAALYAEQARGEEVFAGMLRQFRRWSLEESEHGPVYLGARLGHIEREPRVFRALVYNKGAAVLHMLRRLLGDDTFFDGVRRFYVDRRYQKAGTEDFKRAMETASGRALDRFFDRWVYGTAIPEVRYETEVADGQVTVRLEQLGELVFDLPVTVTVRYADGRTAQTVVPMAATRIEWTVPADGPVRRVEINADHAALAEFDER